MLIGKWTEEQERKILLTLDPIAAMAEGHERCLSRLIFEVHFENRRSGRSSRC